jgi:hypothetical protein
LPQFDILDEFELVEFYSEAWRFFERGFKSLQELEAPKSLLRVSPSDYVNIVVLTNTQAALAPWEQSICAPMQAPDNRLTAAQWKCLAMIRRGDFINTDKLTRDISHFYNSISLMTSTSDLGSGLYKLSHDPKDMEHFEVQHLRAVSDYHTTERIFLREDTLLTNLERFYDSWDSEHNMVEACKLETLKTQVRAWFASMLKDYWGDIYAECEELLRVSNEGPLALIFTVIETFGGEDKTAKLRTTLETHIKQTALAAVSRLHGGDAGSAGDPVTCATTLLKVEQQINELWTGLYLDNETAAGLELKQATRIFIAEIVDEHPEWRDAMDKLDSPLGESDSEETSSPGTPKVVDEAVSSLDLRNNFC